MCLQAHRTGESSMTIDELYGQLCEAALEQKVQRYSNGIGLLDYFIEREGSIVRVCDKERGRIIATEIETENEDEACRVYLDGALKYGWHLTRSPDKALIEKQQSILEQAGIAVERNDLPDYVSPGGVPHYRIFIAGRDFKKARQLLEL